MKELKNILLSNIFQKHGIIYYLITELMTKLLLFITIPVFANIWTKEEFGKFSLYISALPIISILMDLSQRVSLKRFYIDNNSPKKSFQLISTIFIFCFAWFLLIFLLSFCFKIDGFLNRVFISLILLNGFLIALLEVILSYLQISEQVCYYNMIYILKQALPYALAALIVLFFKITSSLVFPLIQLFVFIPLVIIILIIIINKAEKPYFDIDNLKFSLKMGLPVIPAVLSALALNFADRYIIAYFYSTKEVAEYSIAYTVATILSMVVLACNKAWQPFILKNMKYGNFKKIKKYARIYAAAILSLSIIIFIFSRWIILLLSNESYLVILDIIPVLLGAMFFYFLYTIYSNVAFYYRKMLFFSTPALLATIVNTVLNFLLIPIYGYKIAAWTTLFSYFLEFLIVKIISVKIFKVELL